jgi:hypothetical protein
MVRAPTLLVLMCALMCPLATAATLEVGPGKPYAAPCEALAAVSLAALLRRRSMLLAAATGAPDRPS